MVDMAARIFAIVLFCTALCPAWAQKYSGPTPPKNDVVYLVHASNLIPTEVQEAQQEGKKDSSTYTVQGAASPARTPLAEPIFLISADKISPESLELYKFDVKNGRRELTLRENRRRGGPRPYRVSVTRLGNGLYKLEADEILENGEYGLSPSGSNRVFCFQVY
jgi:hypothetical protein